ncbi:MAG TPA: FAD/NAD(P)-binding oxidoreductase [Polyangia bacterium]|jgi:NADPH-dependent 2,4-dienoyl-CoA reductase/sulfur reductase-like enzyme
MPKYRYVIVGGGMAADAAARGVRELDRNAPVALLSASPTPPYQRPPLTKGLWKGKPLDEIWCGTDQLGIELHLGVTIRALDLAQKRVVDDRGTVYEFGKLLLVTGGTPRRLPAGGEHAIAYRTLEDYRHLRELAARGRRFVVVGGGFIGAEIAAALAMNGKQVTMLFSGDGIGHRVFPPELSRYLNEFYGDKGVDVRPGETAAQIESRDGGQYAVRARRIDQNGQAPLVPDLIVDGVVAGIGIEPNVALAAEAGLGVDDGILVDELLRTTHPDVHAAGDVANFFSPQLGHRMRVEHEDNANVQGRAAGRAMAGQAEPYHHLPFFYSDLFELGYEAVGEIDSRLQTIADWKEPFRKGVVYYLREGRVRGVLLWNVWNQVETARQLVAAPGPFTAEELKGRI